MTRKAAPQRLIPKEAAEAADRIAARLKGDQRAITRLQGYVARQAASEAPKASDVVRQAVLDCGLSREELCRRTGVEPASGVDFKRAQPGWAVALGLCLSPTDL